MKKDLLLWPECDESHKCCERLRSVWSLSGPLRASLSAGMWGSRRAHFDESVRPLKTWEALTDWVNHSLAAKRLFLPFWWCFTVKRDTSVSHRLSVCAAPCEACRWENPQKTPSCTFPAFVQVRAQPSPADPVGVETRVRRFGYMSPPGLRVGVKAFIAKETQNIPGVYKTQHKYKKASLAQNPRLLLTAKRKL